MADDRLPDIPTQDWNDYQSKDFRAYATTKVASLQPSEPAPKPVNVPALAGSTVPGELLEVPAVSSEPATEAPPDAPPPVAAEPASSPSLSPGDVPAGEPPAPAAPSSQPSTLPEWVSDKARSVVSTLTGSADAGEATAAARQAGADPSWLQKARQHLGRQEYINLCQQFVENQQGQNGVYPSAIAAYSANKDRVRTDFANARPGDIAYYGPHAENGGYGHVGFVDKNGTLTSATSAGVRNTPLRGYFRAPLLGYLPQGADTAPLGPAAEGAALGNDQGQPAISSGGSFAPASASAPEESFGDYAKRRLGDLAGGAASGAESFADYAARRLAELGGGGAVPASEPSATDSTAVSRLASPSAAAMPEASVSDTPGQSTAGLDQGPTVAEPTPAGQPDASPQPTTAPGFLDRLRNIAATLGHGAVDFLLDQAPLTPADKEAVKTAVTAGATTVNDEFLSRPIDSGTDEHGRMNVGLSLPIPKDQATNERPTIGDTLSVAANTLGAEAIEPAAAAALATRTAAELAPKLPGAVGRIASEAVLDARGVPRMAGAGLPEKVAQLAEGGSAALPEGAQPIVSTAEQEVARLRLDKFPEEVRQTIADAAQSTDSAKVQRRGVISDAAAENLASDSSAATTFDDWVKSSPAGKALNTEETRSLRNAVTAQAETVNTMTADLAAARSAGTDTTLMLARTNAEIEKLQALTTIAEGARAEWGRAGRAYQAAAKAVDLAPEDALARIVKRFGSRDAALDAITEYQKLVDSGASVIDMAKYWARAEKPPVGVSDWFRLLRYNSMLSGPRTQEVNLVGNALEVPWRLGRDTLASAIRLRPQEIGPEAAGLKAGLEHGLEAFKQVLRHGITEAQATAGDLPTAVSVRLRNPVAKGAATALEAPGRWMQAIDELAQQTGYYMGLGRNAALRASSEGLRGPAWKERVAELLQNPSPAEVKSADAIAQRLVFHGDMGKLGQAFGALGQTDVGNIILPFVRTVYHITARGVDRSPLGALWTAADVAKGTYGPRTLSNLGTQLRATEGPVAGVAPLGERVGDAAMGSLASMYFVNQGLQGNISAAGPDDPQARQSLMDRGWRPYSVHVGDNWVSYSNWGPIGVALALPAAMAETIRYHNDYKGAPALAAESVKRFGGVFLDQTYLQGIQAVVQAVSDPANYSSRWLAQFVSSLIPYGAALNTVGQATDDTARQPLKPSQGLMENIGQTLESRLPGLRENVRPATNSLGEPQPELYSGWRAVRLLRVSPEQRQPLVEAYAQAGLGVPAPPPTLTFKGYSVDISKDPELQDKYKRIQGQMLKDYAAEIVTDKSYTQATDTEKAYIVQKLDKKIRESVTKQVLSEMDPKDLERRVNQKTDERQASQATRVAVMAGR